jgi:hypothetical protein
MLFFMKQGLDLVSAEVNKVHEKGEIYNLAEAVVKIKFSRQNATSAAAEM